MELIISNNKELSRFETELNGEVAYLEYKLHADHLILTHTFAPLPMRGKGVSSSLAKFALDYAIKNKMKVIVLCSFVLEYIETHPAYKSKLKIVTP